tara:strand:- start:495 stop:2549 length:2055 start_codon:yes stop_codon:yes gene_type:complete
MKNWDKILKDFSHKCKGGEPDFTNSTHLNYLRESILKYDEEFRNNTYALNEFIGNLRNGKEIITEDWWSDMTPAQQAQYIKDHPKSQKALDAKDKETEKDSATSKITREDIDIIDGEEKQGGLNETVKAPGNLSSVINEVGTGIGMSHLSDNPNMSVNELEELLFEEMMTNPPNTIGDSNGADKTRGACRAAAKSAKREFERSQETIKKNGMNPETTKTSHVWGAKKSLQNTVDHLEKLGITEVNGIPMEDTLDKDGNVIKKGYKTIILEGGAGENPTDTMVVMVDDSVKPPKAVINHTSNKTSSNDIQGNSSPEKNAQAMRKQSDRDLKDNKITKEEHKVITEKTAKLEKDLAGKQKEINDLIQEQNDELNAKLPRGIIDELKVLSKPTAGGTSAKYWKDVVTNHQKKVKPPLNPPISKRQFDTQTGNFDPPLTPEEEERVAASYVNEMQDAANGVDGATEPTSGMTKILARVQPPPEEELNQLYKDQHELITNTRNELNESVKSENSPQPYGDYVASKNFLGRLHLDVVEGHDPGGIPAENFEVNMGNNDSGIKYDKDGNEWVHTAGGNYKRVNSETGEPEGKSQKFGKGELSKGDNAVVVNKENIAKCLGVKAPSKDIAENIRVSEVKSSKGASGYVTIYDLDGNVIGEQTIRPKGGKGTKVQDTISFSKSFQKCLQRESK